MPLVDRFGDAIVSSAAKPKWRGTLGVNLTSGFAFANVFDGNDWETENTLARLKAIRAAGFDFVRVPFNPTYLLNASSKTVMAQRFAPIDAAIGVCLQAGLKVYLNNHLWSLPAANDWPAATVLAAYPNGAAFTQFLTLTDVAAAALEKYDTDLVAYGQLNEAPGTYANWSAIALAIYTRFRASNEQTTVFVSGDGYSGPDDLLNFDPSGFTGNFRVAFTPYDPQLFTHRRVADTVPYDIPLDMNFPPIPSQKASVVAAMEANVDADASVPAGQKAAWKATLAGYINDYIDGRNGLEKTWLNRKLAAVVGWARRNNIPAEDLIISEVGCSTSGGFGDSQRNSNMRWLAGQASYAKLHGIGGLAVWDYSINGPFSINNTAGVLDDDYTVAVGGVAAAAPDPRIRAMLNLQGTSGPSAPSLRAQEVIAAASRRLQARGLWNVLSLFYLSIGVAETADQSLYCWKKPGANKLVVTGTPIFEPRKGWRSSTGKTDGVTTGTDLLDTGYSCDYTDGLFIQNGNHFGIWQNDGFGADDYTQFIAGDMGQNYINVSPSSMVLGLSSAYAFNGVTVTDDDLGTDVLGTARKGHFVGVRENATTLTVYKDGELIAGSIASNSAAYNPLAGTVKLLRTNSGQLGGFHCGGKLTAQNVIEIYTIIDFVRVAMAVDL